MSSRYLILALVLALGVAAWLLGAWEENAPPGDTDGPLRSGGSETEADGQGAQLRGHEAPPWGSTDPGPAPDPIPLPPLPVEGASGSFCGTVFTSAGLRAPDTRVVLIADRGQLETRTDASGQFGVDVPPGRYDARFLHMTLGGVYLRQVLVDGRTPREVQLREPGLLILRYLRVAERRPLRGLRVSIAPARGTGPWAALARGVTDADGRVEFHGRCAGLYEIRSDVGSGLVDTRERNLKPGDEHTLFLEGPAEWSLVGRVVDAETGVPVSAARVCSEKGSAGSGAGFLSTCDTDAAGAFSIPSASQATGRLRVEASGYASWPGVLTVQRDSSHAVRVDALTRTILHPDVRLVRGVRLQGMVRHVDGHGLGGVELCLVCGTGYPSPPPSRAKSAPDGSFVFPHAVATRCELLVATEGYHAARQTRLDLRDLDAGATHTVDVKVMTGREVLGVVVDAEGRPAPGTRVYLSGLDRPDRVLRGMGIRAFETFADLKGQFALRDVPLGTDGSLHATSGSCSAAPVTLGSLGDPAPHLTLVLSPSGSVRGRIRGISKAIRNLPHLVLEPQGRPLDRVRLETHADSFGKFHFRYVAAGAWLLTASFEGRTTPAPIDVEMPDEGGEVAVDVTLASGRELEGYVVNDRGHAVPGAVVSLHGRLDGDRRQWIDRETRTGRDGGFRLPDVGVGRHAIAVEAPGYRRASIKARGDERAVEVRLTPK